MTKQNIIPDTHSFEEDEEKLLHGIKRMRSLLEEERSLKVRKDDNFLLRYLRSSQYDPELAVAKMKTYYTLKHQHPEWYITKERVSSFKSELENHLFFLLEGKDRFGKRIYINKLAFRHLWHPLDIIGVEDELKKETRATEKVEEWMFKNRKGILSRRSDQQKRKKALKIPIVMAGMIDPSKTTMAKQSQLQDLFLECILDEEETQKCGLSIIVDLKNFSWTLLKWLTPVNVSIAVKKIESLPLKKIEFNVVNMTVLVNAAVKLIWPFLSAKTKENIHFHYDWISLHKKIDPACLPPQYGGTKLDLNVQKLLEIVPGNKEWLSENLQMGYRSLES